MALLASTPTGVVWALCKLGNLRFLVVDKCFMTTRRLVPDALTNNYVMDGEPLSPLRLSATLGKYDGVVGLNRADRRNRATVHGFDLSEGVRGVAYRIAHAAEQDWDNWRNLQVTASFCDITNLTTLTNETADWGFGVGDIVISAFGHAVEHCLRKRKLGLPGNAEGKDSARFRETYQGGSDEFIILAPHKSVTELDSLFAQPQELANQFHRQFLRHLTMTFFRTAPSSTSKDERENVSAAIDAKGVFEAVTNTPLAVKCGVVTVPIADLASEQPRTKDHRLALMSSLLLMVHQADDLCRLQSPPVLFESQRTLQTRHEFAIAGGLDSARSQSHARAMGTIE